MKHLLTHALLILSLGVASAQPGTLDAEFADQAVFRNINFLEGPSEATTHTVVDSQDRIWIAGYTLQGGDYQLILVRLTADGQYDTDFAGQGYAALNVANNNIETVQGLAMQDDKLLIAGHQTINGITSQFVLRFTSEGTLDNTFADSGMADLPFNIISSAMVVDNEGNIYISGMFNGNITVTKLLPDGEPDESFNGFGLALIESASTDESASLALDEEGNIFVFGNEFVNGTTNALIIALQPNGSLLSSFNLTGRRSYPLGSGDNFSVSDGIISADGSRFYLAGMINNEGLLNCAIMATSPNGNLLESFSEDGVLEYDPTIGGDEMITSIIEGEHGLYVTMNMQESPVGINAAVALFDETGSLVSAFGQSGLANYNVVQAGDDQALDLAFQSDGRLILIGIASGGQSQFYGYAARITTSIPQSVDSHSLGSSIHLYPNPAVNEINFELENNAGKNHIYQIFSMRGEEIIRGETNAGQTKVSVASLPQGSYLVLIDGQISKRFLKVK